MSLKSLKVVQNASHYWKKPLLIILKSLEFFEKALHHFKKASIPMKMSSKSLVIFEESSDFLLKPPFL
jgi:hypothetical protein